MYHYPSCILVILQQESFFKTHFNTNVECDEFASCVTYDRNDAKDKKIGYSAVYVAIRSENIKGKKFQK